MKNTIELLDYLDDTGLRQFQFDFEKREITFEFLFWDDIQNQEISINFILSGISKFETETHLAIPFQVVGCLQANCIFIAKNQYEVTFLFDLLAQSAGWKMVVGFEKLEIENLKKINALLEQK